MIHHSKPPHLANMTSSRKEVHELESRAAVSTPLNEQHDRNEGLQTPVLLCTNKHALGQPIWARLTSTDCARPDTMALLLSGHTASGSTKRKGGLETSPGRPFEALLATHRSIAKARLAVNMGSQLKGVSFHRAESSNVSTGDCHLILNEWLTAMQLPLNCHPRSNSRLARLKALPETPNALLLKRNQKQKR